jgi:ribonuclease VapC
MSTVVLDASALLAAINLEAGHQKLTDEILNSAVCSAVNLAEVQSKLVSSGLDPNDAFEIALSPVHEVAEFTESQAMITGSIIPQTKPLGLSLGDRACLALAMSLNAPVYTTDRAWKNLKLPIRIHVIR